MPLKLSALKIGEVLTMHTPQFGTTNEVIFTSRDRTPLKREIGYFEFADRPGHSEFAIWQHELDGCTHRLERPSAIPIFQIIEPQDLIDS